MTRLSTKQHGVTLVEVMLTLAISALLITTVLAGRNSLRSSAQFSDGVERIKETILSTKSEANTSNNKLGKGTSSSSGAPIDPNDPSITRYILIGQSLLFDTAKPAVTQSANILCYGTTDFVCGDKVTSSIGSQKNISTPWGIKYTGYSLDTDTTLVAGKLNIVFARNDQTGSFTGSWYPADTISINDSKYAVLSDHQEPITLHFESNDGRKAIVRIEPASGAVTRTIQ